MNRRRMIAPEILTSPSVTSWSRDVRLCWNYLLLYLDNWGYGPDEPATIRGQLFPRDLDITDAQLDDWLAIISASTDDEAPLCRFTVGRRRYLHAVNWDAWQKLSHPGYRNHPVCPIHDGDRTDGFRPVTPTRRGTFRKPSGKVPEAVRKPSGKVREDFRSEVEVEVEVEKNSLSTASTRTARFDEFWDAYPKKVGKADAQVKFDKALKRGIDPDAVIAGVRRYVQQLRRDHTEARFIANPATWLHQGRWDDEPTQQLTPARPVGWEFG